MADIKEVLLLSFITFLIKRSHIVVLIHIMKNYEKVAEELHKPIIKKFKKKRFIPDLKIIFEVLI